MNFTIYSKQGCPYCDKIKKVLTILSETKKYNLTINELNKDFNREEFYSKFGEGSTFPQVVLDDNYIGGCTDSILYLQENNLL
jgi:glutaredoxin 3